MTSPLDPHSLVQAQDSQPSRPRSSRRADHDAGPSAETATVEDLLDNLVVLAQEAKTAEAKLRAHVQLLRGRRATWTEIGEVLNVSRQAAWQRFSGSAHRSNARTRV